MSDWEYVNAHRGDTLLISNKDRSIFKFAIS